MREIERTAARIDRIMSKPDPERIWLGSKCEEVAGERTWSAHPEDCPDCDQKSVEYVRADLVTATSKLALREVLIDVRDSLVNIQESVAARSGSNNTYAYNHAAKAIERVNAALSRS